MALFFLLAKNVEGERGGTLLIGWCIGDVFFCWGILNRARVGEKEAKVGENGGRATLGVD